MYTKGQPLNNNKNKKGLLLIPEVISAVKKHPLHNIQGVPKSGHFKSLIWDFLMIINCHYKFYSKEEYITKFIILKITKNRYFSVFINITDGIVKCQNTHKNNVLSHHLMYKYYLNYWNTSSEHYFDQIFSGSKK